ncbi:MAG: hypothetical protein AMJ79_14755 [Phycisphaerae bacterium SM23_30]|nr:MAG: hypothetical protein AMJ79_14755 [Phycisphaerae bacterium SM23_30]
MRYLTLLFAGLICIFCSGCSYVIYQENRAYENPLREFNPGLLKAAAYHVGFTNEYDQLFINQFFHRRMGGAGVARIARHEKRRP